MTRSPSPTDQPAASPLPERLASVVEEFQAVPEPQRLELLLEFANSLPDLPERLTDHPELLEPVPECQSPVFVLAELDSAGPGGSVTSGTGTAETGTNGTGTAETGTAETGTDGTAAGGTSASGTGSVVRVYASAPRESPTTRGFAAILVDGLDGLTAPEVLAVPLDVGRELGLDRAVSPLRLRGLEGMLTRIRRQVADKAAAASG